MKSFAVPFLAVLALSILAACTPAPAGTPTPAPTNTPAPIAPVMIDPEEDPQGFLAALPSGEVECASNAAGGQAQLVAMLQSEGEGVDGPTALAIAGCFSARTGAAVLIGRIEAAGVTLSDVTRACVGARLPDNSLALAFADAEIGGQLVVDSMEALFCLNTEERVALETTSSADFDFTGFAGGINGMECIFNAVGEVKLTALFADGQVDASVAAAMGQCGLITDEMLAPSGLTLDQFTCIADQLGDDANFLIFGGEPVAGVETRIFPALEACGVEVEDFPTGPTGGEPGAAMPFTTAQLACMSENIAPETMSAMMRGEVPDAGTMLGMMSVLQQCGIDIDALMSGASGSFGGEFDPGEGSPLSAEQLLCLQAEAGEDMAAMIENPSATPSPALLAAFQTCEVDLEAFLDAP